MSSRRSRVLRLLNHYEADGQTGLKSKIARWMGQNGASPQDIMLHARVDRAALCAYIKAIAADLAYLDLPLKLVGDEPNG